MSWITQNAPFGTDNTPVLAVKIVGGKRVEVLAEDNENASHETQGWQHIKSPPRGPNGTPSMLTQPLFQSYEYSDLQQRFNTAKQHKLAREVTSYTSPNGDRSRSFRHGEPQFKKHPVLPPIGVSQPAANYAPRSHELSNNNFNLESLKQDISDVQKASLESLVALQISGFKSDKIKDMYIELTGFDRHLSGFVNEAQLNLVALRYELPLKLSTLKLVFHKFADPHDSRLINYEKFLQFLSSCLTQSTVRRKDAKNGQSQKSPAVKAIAGDTGYKSDFKAGTTETTSVEEKLVSLLREQLGSCDEIDIPELRSALASADRLGNHQLPAEVVEKVCIQQRVPLTSSIMTKMLSHAEISNGIIDWVLFLELLVRAGSRQGREATQGSVSSTSSGRSHESPTRSANVEKSAPWERKPLRNIQSPRSLHNGNDFEASDPTNGNRYPATSKTRSDTRLSIPPSKQSRALSLGWDEREPRPIQGNQSMSQSKGELCPRRTESWMRNFTRLAHALRHYHPFQSDVLPRNEVVRMAENYNLIYNLGFTHEQLTDSVNRAVCSSSKQTEEPTVSVTRFLENLADDSS